MWGARQTLFLYCLSSFFRDHALLGIELEPPACKELNSGPLSHLPDLEVVFIIIDVIMFSSDGEILNGKSFCKVKSD